MQNRIIKFRVTFFRREEKEAHEGKPVYWTSQTPDADLAYVLDNHDYAVDQFTGLLDKNGKEIYEGDIVHDILDDTRHLVKWYGSDDYPAFDLDPGFGGEINGFSEAANDRESLEVIGNIHENPDLIESAAKQT